MVVNHSGGTFRYSCTTPLPSSGSDQVANITSDPLFVDAAKGDYRLQVGSPCINKGSNAYVVGVTDLDGNLRIMAGTVDMGAYECVPITVTVVFDGQGGTVSPASKDVTTCQPYGTLPTLTRTGYLFVGWFTATSGGERMIDSTTMTELSDHTLYAQWMVTPVLTGDWYVNENQSDDFGNGKSWATAKKTIQAAANAAAAGEMIVVWNGVYAPISTGNKAITIQSVNGAKWTIIDGGGTNRCATLLGSGSPSHTNTTLVGFTLCNGNASHTSVTILRNHGGGSYGGTLYNCTLTGNTASGNGGGSYYGTLNNCLLRSNTVSGNGGGAYYGTLNNCTLTGNRATSSTGCGGAYNGTLNNCIVWDNFRGSSGNTVVNHSGSTFRYSCTIPSPSGSGQVANITSTPRFVDAANGDYRLQMSSPCINKGLNAYAVGTTDLDGKPRILNGAVDMGAYESGDMLPQSSEIPVAVPFDWLDGYRGWKGVTGYADLAQMQGANGYYVWESYVAGLNPTDANSKFAITSFAVGRDNGKDAVSTLDWAPDLRPDRVYTVWGKTNLTDSAWHFPTNDATRFFKVEVKMP